MHFVAAIVKERVINTLKGEDKPAHTKDRSPAYDAACEAIRDEHEAIRLLPAAQARCDERYKDVIRATPAGTFSAQRLPFQHTGVLPSHTTQPQPPFLEIGP
jgi:hypothetical protein